MIDGENSVHDGRRELLGQSSVEFGGERCPSDREEEFSVDVLLQFECVQELG
jgi:hypothetical protein